MGKTFTKQLTAAYENVLAAMKRLEMMTIVFSVIIAALLGFILFQS